MIKMPSYSDMLRQDRSYGALGMLSGDKVLAPMGQQLTKQSVITPDQAFTLQSAIQARATAAQQGAERLRQTADRTKAYREDIAAKRKVAGVKGARDAAMYDMKRTEFAQGQQDRQALDKDELKLLKPMAKMYQTLVGLEDWAKNSEGVGGFSSGDLPEPVQTVLGKNVPLPVSEFASWMSRQGINLSPKQRENAMFQNIWRGIEMIDRHSIIGSQITAMEKKYFDGATLSPNWPREQQLEYISRLREVVGAEVDMTAKTFESRGRSPENISAVVKAAPLEWEPFAYTLYEDEVEDGTEDVD